MKAGMILGIIGGVIALLVGAVGYSVTSTLGSFSSAAGDARASSTLQFYSIMSIALPIVGIVGAGLASKNAMLSAGLMGVSCLGILAVFGFGLLSIVPAVLLAIGAGLVVLDNKGSAKPAA